MLKRLRHWIRRMRRSGDDIHDDQDNKRRSHGAVVDTNTSTTPSSMSTTASKKKKNPISYFSRKNIFDLIQNCHWNEVRQLVEGPHAHRICRKTESTGLSVLGMALGFHAPIDIIKTILARAPHTTRQVDSFLAVPLHVACLNGSPLEIVTLILQHDNNWSAYCVDEDRRVPLHHAVEFACRPRPNSEKIDSDEINEGLDVIRLLCETAPEMIRFTDSNEDTPIDIAQIVKSEAPGSQHIDYRRANKVYLLLKEYNVKIYKNEKKRFESEWNTPIFAEREKIRKPVGKLKDSPTKRTEVTDSTEESTIL